MLCRIMQVSCCYILYHALKQDDKVIFDILMNREVKDSSTWRAEQTNEHEGLLPNIGACIRKYNISM